MISSLPLLSSSARFGLCKNSGIDSFSQKDPSCIQNLLAIPENDGKAIFGQIRIHLLCNT